MREKIQAASAAITAQQPTERTAVWMVGEQLKDMVRAEPHLAALVAEDLQNKEMSLASCEKKIKAYADRHKSGSFACVIPLEADRIIREFYGLPKAGEAPADQTPDNVVSLADFF